MAPRRIVSRYVNFVDRHRNAILALLLVLCVLLALFAAGGWLTARNANREAAEARERVTRLEVERAAEKAAREQGEKISQVVTCFNAVRSRPLLTDVLRFIAALAASDPVARQAADTLVDVYESQPTPGIKGEPTRPKCLQLAERLGVDPAAYDVTAAANR